jgi:hypothetical protein
VQAERKGDVSSVVTLKPHGGIDRFLDDLFRCVGGDFLDLHPTLSAGDKNRPACVAIDENRKVELLGDIGPFFHQETMDLAAFRTGLMRHERLADEFLGKTGDGALVLGNLDPACLATPTRMDLRLHDEDRRIQFIGPSGCGFGRGDLLSTRHRHSELGKELLCLKLVNVHVAPSASSGLSNED